MYVGYYLHGYGRKVGAKPQFIPTKRDASLPLGRFVVTDDLPPSIRQRPRRVLATGREGSKVVVHLS